MRHSVVSRSYLWRKKLDGILNKLFRDRWVPLYTMVSFSKIPYGEVVEREGRQVKIVKKVASWCTGLMTGVAAIAGVYGILRFSGVRSVSFVLDAGKFGKFVTQ